MDVDFPDWLAQCELDPGPGAYTLLEPKLRAALKTQIAHLFKLWEGSNAGHIRVLQGSAVSTCLACPKAWAMYLLAESYASPAGLIAAVLPAVMAGVENIFICRAGESNQPLHPSLSAALELLGQEYVYALSTGQSAALVSHLAHGAGGAEGVLVLLGPVEDGIARLGQAASCRAGVYALPQELDIAIDIALDMPKNFTLDAELFKWLHPAARLTPIHSAPAACHAIIGESSGAGAVQPKGAKTAPLALAPGQECFWLWPELTPQSFVTRRHVISENRQG